MIIMEHLGMMSPAIVATSIEREKMKGQGVFLNHKSSSNAALEATKEMGRNY